MMIMLILVSTWTLVLEFYPFFPLETNNHEKSLSITCIGRMHGHIMLSDFDLSLCSDAILAVESFPLRRVSIDPIIHLFTLDFNPIRLLLKLALPVTRLRRQIGYSWRKRWRHGHALSLGPTSTCHLRWRPVGPTVTPWTGGPMESSSTR